MLGERLATARRRAGLTQAKLADALGDRYDQTTVSAVERGRSSLRLDGVVGAARALGVSTDWLLGLVDDPAPLRGQAPPGSWPPPSTELALNAYEPSRPAEFGQPVIPVLDQRLAMLLSAIADHYEDLNELGRAALVTRFNHFFPDLPRAGESGRIITWLGWEGPV